MIAEGGEALRIAREARGIGLDQVSEATRIPVQILQALEAEHLDTLPEGPYRFGQVRAYCSYLGMEPSPEFLARLAPRIVQPPQPLPRWVTRVVALVLAVGLGGAALWLLSAPTDPTDDTAIIALENAPDQRVRVVAQRTTRLKILVDGEVAVDRRVPGGEAVDVEGHRRIEVHLEGAEAARVEYNGDLIVPQGRQDVPRRLVFIDDLDQDLE